MVASSSLNCGLCSLTQASWSNTKRSRMCKSLVTLQVIVWLLLGILVHQPVPPHGLATLT
jgi:hypothetical protein